MKRQGVTRMPIVTNIPTIHVFVMRAFLEMVHIVKVSDLWELFFLLILTLLVYRLFKILIFKVL